MALLRPVALRFAGQSGNLWVFGAGGGMGGPAAACTKRLGRLLSREGLHRSNWIITALEIWMPALSMR